MDEISLQTLADDDLVPSDVACRLIGGRLSPIDPSTLYRGVQAGRYPKPLKVGPSTNRWSVGELRACLRNISGQRTGAE